jgi:SulP family sulfate permease
MNEHARAAWAGDLWGGLAAMLVALPSAIAFGVTIFAPLGAGYAAQGALAGILGATALGLVAPLFGGTNRLITAPCAPAAAVLAAFAIELAADAVAPATILALLAIVALACGALQLLFGALGLGRLIKYMPYPVVSGYLSGVGLVIVFSQVPRLLGAADGAAFMEVIAAPSRWVWQAIAVGAVTIAVMLGAPRLTQRVPAAILALAAGVCTYFAIASWHPQLLHLSGNTLVVGAMDTGGGVSAAFSERWAGLSVLGPAELQRAMMPALTLSVLLSIDTLKTCVVLDALTRTRHDSNRELRGQGLANLAATVIGGVPGAGQMGATLVNLSSGGRTRVSGVIEGALSLIAFLALGALVAWVPIAALAGILIVIGLRMVDWRSLNLLRSRATVVDFAVIVVVILVASTVSLIAASGVGVALAVLLFVREQIGGSVVRHKRYGNRVFSRRVRGEQAMALLAEHGAQTAIVELQGSLFFGTADQLYSALEPELATRRYIILDLRRVQTVDVTAAHMLERVEDALAERGGMLLFSELPRRLPSGRDMQAYFSEIRLVDPVHRARVFDELDDALEWVEESILAHDGFTGGEEKALELAEMELLAGRKPDTIRDLEACMQVSRLHAGEKIFAYGDMGDELYLIRRGEVRIMLPIETGQAHHLATFGRGAFFGEMAFLDPGPRSADAVAFVDCEIFVLSRARFEEFAANHKRAALALLQGIARALAVRLRYTNAEVQALREG